MMSQTPLSAEPVPTNDEATIAEQLQVLLRYLRVVVARIEIVVLSLVASCLIGALYYATAERRYRSTGTLLVLQMGSQVRTTELMGDRAAREMMGTYEKMVTGDEVMANAIQRIPAPHRVDFAGIPAERWPQALRQNLSVGTLRNTNIINITYTSKSPDAAPVVVDAVVGAYLDHMAQLHQDTSKEVIVLLQKEWQTLDQEIREKEMDRIAAIGPAGELTISDGSANVVTRRAISLNEAYIKAHQERLGAEASLVAVREALASGRNLHQHVSALANSLGNEVLMRRLGLGGQDMYVQAQMHRQLLADKAELQTLQERGFGANHSKVRDTALRVRLAEEFLNNQSMMMAARVESLTNEQLAPILEEMALQRLQQAVAQERTIWESYHQQKELSVGLNQKTAELAMLDHDIERLRARLDDVRDRLRTTRFNENGSMLRTAWQNHPARPQSPAWPSLTVVAAVSVGFGLLVGLIIVYILDVLDDRFRSPEEIQSQLNAPVLTMVQRLDPLDGVGGEAIHVCVQPNAVETECFRTLRTTLALLRDNPQRLVVSSSEPGDGKTTISSNLAAALAQAGRRTLLIDADLRRPGLTPQLGLKGTRGLSALLRDIAKPVSEAVPENMFQQIAPNLDVIPSGPRPTNPVELLSGERFSDLLAWAESVYDQVVIDCPPTLAVSDPAVVGRQVDGLILVVRPDKNRRRLVLRAVERLRSLGVNVSGIAVNQVEAAGGYGYYGYDYGYSYAYGHDSVDEPDDALDDYDDIDEDPTDEEAYEGDLRRLAA